jgi:hypothetical protein
MPPKKKRISAQSAIENLMRWVDEGENSSDSDNDDLEELRGRGSYI